MDKVILAVDEVGRGPLAGPVVAAAVILSSRNTDHIEIKDSKKMSEKKIILSASQIRECSAYAIGIADVVEIEEFNILKATMLAMRRAIEKINMPYDLIHVDGIHSPYPGDNRVVTIISGDSICRSISAASIVAKDYRDNMMRNLDQLYPQYYLSKNKGYGTKDHMNAIREFGLSEIHRKSFCKKFLNNVEVKNLL